MLTRSPTGCVPVDDPWRLQSSPVVRQSSLTDTRSESRLRPNVDMPGDPAALLVRSLEVRSVPDGDVGLRVLSWKEAATFVHLWPTHLISLVDPEDADLVAESPRPDLARLELFVGDVTDPGHRNAATENDVARLVAFGEGLEDGAKLLCHCRAGIGRSPAAALIALVAAGVPVERAWGQLRRVRPISRPNPWLLLLGDRQLSDADGNGVFATWLSWAHQQEFWWPVPSKILADALSGRASWATKVELVMAQTHKQRGVDRGRFRR